MKFYIDFEATQPGDEIIAIGAVSENGDTFKRFVKPQLSQLTGYITQLTGIRKTDIDGAATAEEVFSDLYDWCMRKSNCQACTKWEFYAFGNCDAGFIKATLPTVKEHGMILFMCYMATTLQDYSKIVTNYFQGGVSLIKAFNYIETLDKVQIHDPLEDALMLKDVFDKIDGAEPLTDSPFCDTGKKPAAAPTKMPSGVFWCYTKGKKQKTLKFFNSCDEAIDWIIKTYVNADMRASVHRDKMMVKIMRAIQSKSKYNNLLWGRDKNRTIEELKEII